MTKTEPRVLLIAGYFDWFSGYQETALATAFSKIAATEVIASDRVSPAFSDDHLERIGVPRRYIPGTTGENGVTVTRFRSFEIRSMVWSNPAIRYISGRSYDLIVQVMPGQLLSAAPSFSSHASHRVVLYGDNRAMWANLSLPLRLVKGGAFALSKGVLYTLVNGGSSAIYGYTPNTIRRLRPFSARRRMQLMPLAYSPQSFFRSRELRRRVREDLEVGEEDTLIVVAGKLEPRKRVDWVLDAFHRLAPTHPRLRLLVIGSDSSDYSREMEQLVMASPHAGRITMRPFADASALNGYFNAADIGIWPRNPAITIQQAMGTGLAVLLPRNDLVGHLITNDAGQYFDLDEDRGGACVADALADALARTHLTEQARAARAENNNWMSADTIVRDLLAEVGGHR